MAVLCCAGSFNAEKFELPLAAAPFDRAKSLRGAARLLYRSGFSIAGEALLLF